MSHDEPDWTVDGYSYADLMAEARAAVRADHGFVDPAKMRACKAIGRDYDWRLSVVGMQRETLEVMHALLIADERGIVPPLPAWLREQREREAIAEAARKAAYEARIAALTGEWEALCKALPVLVKVQYNYSGGHHYGHYSSGADHIIVREQLDAGRLHRAAGAALCSTPSNADRQHFPFARSEPSEHSDDPWPTCKACIRFACKLTGLDAPALKSTRSQ